jgi:peptide/nickel transport system permease protein
MRRTAHNTALQRLRADPVGSLALLGVLVFVAMVAASSSGWLAQGWNQEVAEPSAPPSWFAESAPVGVTSAPNSVTLSERIDLSPIDPLAPYYNEWSAKAATYPKQELQRAQHLTFGADRLGRDVFSKAVKGAEVSITVGLMAALLATGLGTLLGALGGFMGDKVGDVTEWLYNVFTAIPGILLVFMFAAVFNRSDSIFPRGVVTLTLILGFTSWTGVYRLVRAEFIKHANLDYVRAAQALGASKMRCMFVHILPNVNHVALVQLSVLVVACIKAEVILSYLGLGVAVDQVSWGSMLAEAQSELLLGHWWQLAVATVFMAAFVTAFSFLTDALRDALDPKTVASKR